MVDTVSRQTGTQTAASAPSQPSPPQKSEDVKTSNVSKASLGKREIQIKTQTNITRTVQTEPVAPYLIVKNLAANTITKKFNIKTANPQGAEVIIVNTIGSDKFNFDIQRMPNGYKLDLIVDREAKEVTAVQLLPVAPKAVSVKVQINRK